MPTRMSTQVQSLRLMLDFNYSAMQAGRIVRSISYHIISYHIIWICYGAPICSSEAPYNVQLS